MFALKDLVTSRVLVMPEHDRSFFRLCCNTYARKHGSTPNKIIEL